LRKERAVRFAKLQATGNDFVLVEAGGQERDWGRLAGAMCQRRFGIGADGLVVVQSSPTVGLRMRIFNPDGSEAEVCGNGLRCFARYVTERGLAPGDQEMTVHTMAGTRTVKLLPDGRFQVDMGEPAFEPATIPVDIAVDIIPVLDYPVMVDDTELLLTFVSMGNPHGVCFLDDVDGFPLARVGPIVEHDRLFPQRLNFEIARVSSRRRISMRVWERGAGETLSCGSGACAVAVAAQLHGYVDSPVDVVLPGGRLTLEWPGAGAVRLSGGAEFVFVGEWPDTD